MMPTIQEERNELVKRIHKLDIQLAEESLKAISNRYYKRMANYNKNMDEYVKTLGINKDDPMRIDTVNVNKFTTYDNVSLATGATSSMNGYTEITEAEFWTTVESLIPKEIVSWFKNCS